MFKHIAKKLKNGTQVLLIPLPEIRSVTVLALVNVGSRYEEKKNWGISHFLEHMVFKGTDRYPTAQALSLAVDAVGANFNAFTSKEYTGYYVKAASQHLDLALDVVSDMLLAPKIRQEDIDREKGVIIEEINMYADMPSAQIGNLFEQLLFTENTLGHDVIGTKETVSSLTVKDFRDYIHQWYGLENVTLVLAGDAEALNAPEFLDKVQTYFSKADAEGRQAEKALSKLGEKPLLENKLLVEKKQTEQAHFILGFPAMKRDDDRRYALSLLSIILGGGMSSRLFSEIREQRGLCYYIHTDTDFYHDTGVFTVSAGVDPKRVDEALEVTLSECIELAAGDKPITEAELKKAKDFLNGKFILDLEDSETVAQYFGMKQLLLGRVEAPEALLEKYQAVTLKQVQEIAKEVLQKDKVRLAIIGPFDDKSRFEKLLGLL